MCVKEVMSFWREAWVEVADEEEVAEVGEQGGEEDGPAGAVLKSVLCWWWESWWTSCLISVLGLCMCLYVSTCI